jgi:hypothetical protein
MTTQFLEQVESCEVRYTGRSRLEGPCAKLRGSLEQHSSRAVGAQIHQHVGHNPYQLVPTRRTVPHH